MLTVLIVDGSVLIRIGLKEVLAQEYRDTVFGEAKSAAEASRMIPKRSWDLVIIDISLPDRDAFSLLAEVISMDAEIRPPVLMLGMQFDSFNASRARQVGASGYLTLGSNRRHVLDVIKRVLRGKTAFEDTESDGNLSEMQASQTILSPREYEVLLAFARGQQTTEIASALELSVPTVSTFRRRILNKLRLRSTADLIRYAIDKNLV
jgi:DNA-binding NarL/FixJ family response regulator